MNKEDNTYEQSQDINIQNSENKINLLGKPIDIYINPVQKINQYKINLNSLQMN